MNHATSSESSEGLSNRALMVLASDDEQLWRPILHLANQVVLYNPTSHALSIRRSTEPAAQAPQQLCPYCARPLPVDFEGEEEMFSDYHSRAPNYFQLLAVANETVSRPSTPPPIQNETQENSTFPAEMMAQGYMAAFFREEAKLGMGANGSVYLCQHMLDGNPLGHFAVKKIAVGESHTYLLNILREESCVRLLERLQHPNIVIYHHAWLETCQFSPFGPKVPTLHVLMQWAECGSLDDYIDARLGKESHPKAASNPASNSSTPLSRSARIRAFREMQRTAPEERVQKNWRKPDTILKAVHLLSPEEVRSLFNDVVQGLSFLHDRSILHLDLKPGNVLLTMDENRLIPRAMLSDFGTSRDGVSQTQNRSGNTGTLEYTSPESLRLSHQLDSKSDMWSLGMILHRLLFFRLPWQTSESENSRGDDVGKTWVDRLEQEILNYPGFKGTANITRSFEARRLPRAYLILLEGLLNVIPSARPAIDRVCTALREGRLNPLPLESNTGTISTLVPVQRLSGSPEPENANFETEREEEETVIFSEEKSNPEWTEGNPISQQQPQQLLQLPDAPVQPSSRYRRIPRTVYLRAAKSSLLIFKIVTMNSLFCGFFLRDHRRLFMFLAGLGLLDTLFDGLTISLALGLVHVVILAVIQRTFGEVECHVDYYYS